LRLREHPDSIFSGVVPYVGATEKQARKKFEQLQKLIVPGVGFELLGEYLNGIDLR
jgi:hypothetical protein